jgi:hypothetical protein
MESDERWREGREGGGGGGGKEGEREVGEGRWGECEGGNNYSPLVVRQSGGRLGRRRRSVLKWENHPPIKYEENKGSLFSRWVPLGWDGKMIL